MPSANPDLTPNLHLPSPVAADPPDVPGDIKALADRLDAILNRYLQRVQHGAAGVPIVAGQSWASINITFPHPFTGVPGVTASAFADSAYKGPFIASVYNITATGFTLAAGFRDWQAIGPRTAQVSWIAVGDVDLS